jgi:hypothetical protein
MQDFYINMLTCNILSAAYWEAQEIVDKTLNAKENKRKYEYKVNIAQAAGALRDYIVRAVITMSPKKRARLLAEMNSFIATAVVPIRPNRAVTRKDSSRIAKFHHNRKSNL